jgi:uncharacterized membrane protein
MARRLAAGRSRELFGQRNARAVIDWFEHRAIGFVVILAVASAAALTFGAQWSVSLGLLVGFDLAGTLFLIALGVSLIRGDAAHVRERAKRVDAGRWTVLLVAILLSLAALIALGIEIQAAKQASLPLTLLAVTSIIVAWLLMNTTFAFHYAHAYYVGEPEVQRGLEFPGTPSPDYMDFLYFSLVLGMTFQVSDVNIVNSRVRRMALGHAIVAFFFNLGLLALSINLLGSQA